MAVVENARSINVVASDIDQSTKSSYSNRTPLTISHRSNDYNNNNHHQQPPQQPQKVTSLQPPPTNDGNGYGGGDGGDDGDVVNGGDGDGFKKEMSDLEEMLSKLNPMAEEFVPNQRPPQIQFGYAAVNNFLLHANNAVFANANATPTRRKGNYSHGKRRMNSRTSMAQRDDVIKRTVYVSDIDQQVTEEQLAALFVNCGQVVDCRVCGDPNSVLHFAFIEFTDEEGARNALSLGGTMLGYYPVRVLPSKTAIAPVNPTFLPQSEDEREMCARTIYCTNIDKKVTQADVKLFFESLCGEVYRLRLLGDYNHSTRIAFVEFVMSNGVTTRRNSSELANVVPPLCQPSYTPNDIKPNQIKPNSTYPAESAIAALNCSGAVLGSLPIRVSPSKTPVRPRAPRSNMH
ncbi:hypothetical protein OSB04_025955 [Centaurea solstitialis]|uniref:RRM domain-containing protein n=1 Tax=Centaurea solstitialis TaxID=347529 RepID=A0AA38T8J1_9ASTR|nr:hypothetical protein OSB04_025955 [Centaurea solstitialis]